MNLRQQQQSMLPSLGRRRRYFVVLMITMVVLLTGCASGTAHMTVKKDGSLELAFSILLDSRAEAMVGGKLEEVLTTRLEAAGIELKKARTVNLQNINSSKPMLRCKTCRQTLASWTLWTRRLNRLIIGCTPNTMW